MPTGPKGEKRPADVIGNAVRVMQIATGEREEELEAAPPKDAVAVESGRRGGRKRAEVVPAERRTEIARKASETRWRKG